MSVGKGGQTEVWALDDVVTSVHHRKSSIGDISRVHKHNILIWLIVSRDAREVSHLVPAPTFLIESAYEKECSSDGKAHKSLNGLEARSLYIN